MLAKTPIDAQAAANAFMTHLKKVGPSSATKYEELWLQDESKMAQLADFCDRNPPCLLWKNNGKYKDLFTFLADRFLAQPDSVVDCEGLHAAWKWVTTVKRGLSFKMLNAILKLKTHLQEYGAFPDHAALEPHIALLTESYRNMMESVRRSGTIAAGFMSNELYKRRFNLSMSDIDLIKAGIGPYRGIPSTPITAWGYYLRFLFQRNRFYQFSLLSSNQYLLVAENRSKPGRDQIQDASEVLGRPMSVAWFEEVERTMDGIVVRPIDDEQGEHGLNLSTASVAEVCRAAGDYIPIVANTTARDVEVELERQN